MAARGGQAQRRVRETMIAAGGYWRPLAAVARLLEELGELSELLQAGAAREELAAELADLWIITTALADQFLAAVAEPGGGAAGPDPGLDQLLAAAGPIARVVNHYDGPKVPRAGEPMPTLHGAVADFHATLASFAAARGVELADAVAAKIDAIHGRGDIERFGRDGFDPSTAPVLDIVGVEALSARLWGAPDAGPLSCAARRAALAREPLSMFAKAARAESLEGFLIAGPHVYAQAGRASWLGALIAELDRGGNARRFEVAGMPLQAGALALQGRTLALVRAA